MSAGDLNAFVLATFRSEARRTFEVSEVTDRGAVLHLPIGPEDERPGQTVSGPTMMSLADGAAWIATLSRIGPVALAVTSSLTINFLRKPPLTADLWAEAELIRLGRRLSVAEVRLVSAGAGDLVAQSTVTYAIPASA